MVERPDTLPAAARREMADEARAIIDSARKRGLTLRLLGGLAVREHCAAIEFCDRDYLDLDVAGRDRDRTQIRQLFDTLGYRESFHVVQATMGRQLQFFRPCRHCLDGFCAHDDDHVDVFLDTFKMDHEIDLRDSLQGDPYTLSLSETLLTKLQMFELGEKDLRDIVTLLKDVEVAAGDVTGTVDGHAIAVRCARDWGLSHDVDRSLTRVLEMLPGYDLDPRDETTVRERVARLRQAIEAEPKTLAWRLRARVGERRRWHDVVEEQGEDHF